MFLDFKEDIEITGRFSPGSTEYQISRQKDNAGYVVVLPWTSGAVDFVDTQPDPGNYQYKIEYKDPQTGCATEEIVLNATVHELPIVSLQIDDVQCLPYRVKLSASANQPGSFTWSNGMSGSNIVVDHGGPYQVRFKPHNSPCEVVQTIVAPKSPDEFIWIFPTGCFDYCFNRKEPQTYIVGPLPEFYEYAYELDAITQGSTGPGNIPDFDIMNREGKLTLSLDNGYCEVTSDVLHLNIPKACERNCDIIWDIKDLIPIQQTPYSIYAVMGGIQNIHNYGITVDLSSIDGVFTPGSIYIPASSYYDFAAHNMTYMPYLPGNTTVSIAYTVSIQDGGKNDIICHDTFIFVNPSSQKPYGLEHGYAEMKVVPNPVTTTTVVYYTLQDIDFLGEARIDLYGLQGNLISTKKINKLKSEQSFDLGNQASGTYFIIVYHKGQRIGQQILIKK